MQLKKSISVYTMYWDNIPDAIRMGQKSVFDFLKIPLIQENANKVSHGVWMNAVIDRHGSDDVIIFSDIDAFPINAAAYAKAVACALRGGVFGLAQFSNHKKNTEIYAGPMFMAFKKSTWEMLGQPSLKSNSFADAAEVISVLAREKNVELMLEMPCCCLIPKWSLAEYGIFGIGTFYGACDFFHLFESRRPAYEYLFESVVQDVVNSRKLNFKNYLEIISQSENHKTTAVEKNGVLKKLSSWIKVL